METVNLCRKCTATTTTTQKREKQRKKQRKKSLCDHFKRKNAYENRSERKMFLFCATLASIKMKNCRPCPAHNSTDTKYTSGSTKHQHIGV